MDEEDRKVAMDQLTSYDRFASLNRAFAVVAVPPKPPNTQEKWVAVSAVKRVINPSIRQPDQRERPFVATMRAACATGMLTSFLAA